jgi:hypothetical protein
MRGFSTIQAAGANPGAFEVIDWSLYSVLVRNDRRAMGYKKAEEFSASIWRRTRVTVTQETLYKIEQARQVPDTKQFMAINIALYGSPLPERVMDTCVSKEWRQIAEAGGDIPLEWKYENFRKAAGDRADDPTLTPEELAAQVNDAAGLFANPNAPQPAQAKAGAQ